MEYKMENKALIFETNGEVRSCKFSLTPNQKNADCDSKKLVLIWFYEQKVLSDESIRQLKKLYLEKKHR